MVCISLVQKHRSYFSAPLYCKYLISVFIYFEVIICLVQRLCIVGILQLFMRRDRRVPHRRALRGRGFKLTCVANNKTIRKKEIKMLIRAASLSQRNMQELPDFWREVVWGVARQQGLTAAGGPQSAGAGSKSAGSLSFFAALLSKGITLGGLNQAQHHLCRV